ncbi:PUR family DNA/RNA-binding protein [uncultured Algibacter sp.]|uniref:PUR family DNA/RNA-binding protein n=1 Tax=uncultured Algibacter sp. TaxID=298659 RepID=UPI002610A71A|nr:PUR family DNA/RNA-binding protein [uncultured Algibacter sp.]
MYNGKMEQEEIFSKVLRAGRRTYFFDVRATKAEDYYLTITESKKFTNDDGSFHYKKHKIYIYKEDFSEFKEILAEMTDYIINEKGDEVISERHQKDFKKEYEDDGSRVTEADLKTEKTENFTDIDFDDI